MKQKGKHWIAANGNTVENWAINPVLKVEEKYAHRVADAALKAEKALRELNIVIDEAQSEVFKAKLKDAEIKEWNRVPTPESLTFSAYDKTVSVDIKTTSRLIFDKTYVSIIKSKFEDFFKVFDGDEKASGKFAFLREMINTLMYKTNGEIDQTSVNELRAAKATAMRTKVEGWELFVEAVDIFDKAIRTEPGKRLFYVDVQENGKMRRVALKYTDI
jgi:hypothetical protein